jgi:hypothetical protein
MGFFFQKPLLSKLKLLKILLLALSFSFSQYLGLCVFFTLLPVIKLIKDHWHGSRHNYKLASKRAFRVVLLELGQA